MAASWRGVPILMIVALMLFAFGGLIHIIGIATPYWHETTTSNAILKDYKTNHFGLWVACSVAIRDTFDCNSYQTVQDYIVATRAMVILGLLFGMFCIIVTGVWRFGLPDSYGTMFMVVSLSCGFLAALFSFIGIIIYAAEINNIDTDYQQFLLLSQCFPKLSLLGTSQPALFSFIGIIIYAAEINNIDTDQSIPGIQLDNTLAWSFALCTVSSCMAFIATVLLGIGIRQIEK